NDIARGLDRRPVDREQNVASLDAGAIGRGTWNDFNRRHALAASAPIHAVLNFVPASPHGDVRNAKPDQDDHDDGRKDRTSPGAPSRFARLMAGHHGRASGFDAARIYLDVRHWHAAEGSPPTFDNGRQTPADTMLS